jgi:hypothetical protein
MNFIELVVFNIGFWGVMMLLMSSVDACNKVTDQLLERELTSQEGHACCYDADGEPQ